MGAFSKYKLAENHYLFLDQKLHAENKIELRIEKTPHFYTVRIGKTLGYTYASKVYKKVSPFVKDAFIFEESAAMTGTVLLPDPNISQAVSEPDTNQAGIPAEQRHPHDASAKHESVTIHDDIQIKSDGKSGLTDSRSENNSATPASTSKETAGATPAGEFKHHEVDSKMTSFLEKKKYKKAVTYIKKAISKSPRDPALHSWYGSTLIASNRPYLALEQFRKAAELAPGKPEYQNGIGYSYVYINIDSARQSVEAFKKALSVDPNNVDALEGLGAIYASVGDKQQAYKIYRQLAEKDRNAAKRLHTLMSYGDGSREND